MRERSKITGLNPDEEVNIAHIRVEPLAIKQISYSRPPEVANSNELNSPGSKERERIPH